MNVSIQKHLGFNLVEIMLALGLSLILILGLYQILMVNLSVYRQHAAVGYLQENAVIKYNKLIFTETHIKSIDNVCDEN